MLLVCQLSCFFQLQQHVYHAKESYNISKGHNLNDKSQLNSNDFYQGPIFISRFNTLVNVAIKFDGLSDEYADLAGVLFGYNLKDIAGYCLKEVKEKNLVKE